MHTFEYLYMNFCYNPEKYISWRVGVVYVRSRHRSLQVGFAKACSVFTIEKWDYFWVFSGTGFYTNGSLYRISEISVFSFMFHWSILGFKFEDLRKSQMGILCLYAKLWSGESPVSESPFWQASHILLSPIGDLLKVLFHGFYYPESLLNLVSAVGLAHLREFSPVVMQNHQNMLVGEQLSVLRHH